jgi:hypothetical protein
MLKILIIAPLLILALVAKSQTEVNIGYGGGMYTRNFANLDAHAFTLNEVAHPYWTNEIHPHQFFKGISLDVRIIRGGNWNFFFMFNNRTSMYKGGGMNDSTGFDEKFRMKIRYNMVSFMGWEYVIDNMGIGMTLDAGKFKMFYKYRNASNPEAKEWEPFYGGNPSGLIDGAAFGTTITFRYCLERLQAKLMYHMSIMGVDVGDPESAWSYYYKPNNLEFAITYNIWKK